jgi:transposase
MSPAFITGIKAHLGEPRDAEQGCEDIAQGATAGHQPRIVFDRYHVVAKANEAVDTVRRAEAKTRPELKRSRYAWLKNDANLTVKQLLTA